MKEGERERNWSFHVSTVEKKFSLSCSDEIKHNWFFPKKKIRLKYFQVLLFFHCSIFTISLYFIYVLYVYISSLLFFLSFFLILFLFVSVSFHFCCCYFLSQSYLKHTIQMLWMSMYYEEMLPSLNVTYRVLWSISSTFQHGFWMIVMRLWKFMPMKMASTLIHSVHNLLPFLTLLLFFFFFGF